VWEVVQGWMHTHRPDDPRALDDAWHPFCISRRLAAWAVLITRAPCGPERLTGVLASMVAQANFLADHPERDLGGNHLLENARGLALAGALIDSPESERWVTLSERILRAELPRQVLPHGEHFERAPGYHAEIVELLLDVHDAAAEVRPGLSALCAATARPMARFLRAILHPDGDLPLLADSSLWGPERVGRLLDRAGVAARRPPAERGAEVGPYWTFRQGGSGLIFDAGPVGADELPAHAHPDLLTLEASVDGRRVLVDSGVYDYNAGEMRRYCRSSAAHNVLLVDDADQCDMWSSFRMGYRGHPGGLVTGESGGFHWARATHNAYRRLGVPRVGRLVACRPSLWLIVDWAEGRGRHRLSERLHVHPDFQVEPTDGGFRLRCDEFELHIAPLAPGEERIEQGWYCPHFGCRQESRVLLWACECELPRACGWAVTWGESAERAPLHMTEWPEVVVSWSQGQWRVPLAGSE
ncbi:MAG: heparinase II/III domain-containing protein, partial [Pirellulales bacterium]